MSLRFTATTGVTSISQSVKYSEGPWYLNSFRLHLAAGTAGNIVTTLDAAAGAYYDTVLDTQSAVGITDYHYQPTREIPLNSGDEIDITLTCATRWGLVIAWNNNQ